jgi:transcriptional regulator with XRE-family HTH domain
MSATERTFAEMVDQAAGELGLNDYQLSAAIGLMPGNRVCSPKQVSRIRKGEQVNYRPELVERLVAVLKLDAAEAWAASGVLPPEVTAEDLRAIWERRATRQLTAVGRAAQPSEGADLTADPLSSQQDISTTATLLLSPGTRAA